LADALLIGIGQIYSDGASHCIARRVHVPLNPVCLGILDAITNRRVTD
jgi:hypothetical protein